MSARLQPVVYRRALLLAVLGGVLLLAYFGLLHWWLVAPLWQAEDDIEQLRQQQAHDAQQLAERPALMQRFNALRQREDHARSFLPEDDPSAASAGLMQRVVNSVASHVGDGSCEVIQKMPVAAGDQGSDPFRKVVVNISLRCDLHVLSEVLYDLEYGRPYLFISDFTAYRTRVGNVGSGVVVPEVQFTLLGYLHAPASAASSASPRSASLAGGGS